MGIRKDTLFPNTDPPEMIRRRAEALQARPPPERLGQDWLIAYHRERAELAEEYADWPEESGSKSTPSGNVSPRRAG